LCPNLLFPSPLLVGSLPHRKNSLPMPFRSCTIQNTFSLRFRFLPPLLWVGLVRWTLAQCLLSSKPTPHTYLKQRLLGQVSEPFPPFSYQSSVCLTRKEQNRDSAPISTLSLFPPPAFTCLKPCTFPPRAFPSAGRHSYSQCPFPFFRPAFFSLSPVFQGCIDYR